MPNLRELDSAEKIAAAGEELYEKQRGDFERNHPGEFVAVDVRTGTVYVAENAVAALNKARDQAPTGVFHLIQIGSESALRKGYLFSHA